jgi:hypothetical protein
MDYMRQCKLGLKPDRLETVKSDWLIAAIRAP